MAVTAVALMYQCADMARIARGATTLSPKARQARVYPLLSRAFIGLPWPKNAAGIFSLVMGPRSLAQALTRSVAHVGTGLTHHAELASAVRVPGRQIWRPVPCQYL